MSTTHIENAIGLGELVESLKEKSVPSWGICSFRLLVEAAELLLKGALAALCSTTWLRMS